MKLKYQYFFILLLISSCSDSVTKRSSNIFIGGFRQETRNGNSVSYTRYWKNGQPTDVTDGSKWVFIKSMTVSGDDDDVYLGGHERLIKGGQWKAGYWKNEIGVAIKQEVFDIECIAVLGDDIYVGSGNKTSNGENFWKNGVSVTLESSSSINAITTSENDVYAAGISVNSKVAFWKNGKMTEISEAGPYVITSIAVSGNDVYVAGRIIGSLPSTGYYGVERAVYWKNGNMVLLGNGSINSIVVNGSDVYAAGYRYNPKLIGVYWKNSDPVDIEQDLSIVGIAVDGNNLHLISQNAYWKNGKKITLNASDSTDIFRSIIVK